MRKVVWVLAGVAACAPTHGAVKLHLRAANVAMDRLDYEAAQREYKRAEAALFDDPSESDARKIADGLTAARAKIISKAVTSQALVAGNDLAAIDDLYQMDLDLRAAGGDDAVEEKIAEAINIRASLLMAPHEKATDLTDVTPVLALAKYPELSADTRRRLSLLSGKNWRILSARAAATKSPLVARVFAGLAAHYSGAALGDATAVRDAELAPFARGSVVTVETDATCAATSGVKQLLDRKGAFEVDAKLHIMQCHDDTSTEDGEIDEDYVESHPETVTRTWKEYECHQVEQMVRVCDNPYTQDNCGYGGTIMVPVCNMVDKSGDFTEMKYEHKTRKVKHTFQVVISQAEVGWQSTAPDGKPRSGSMHVGAKRMDGVGPSLLDNMSFDVAQELNEPVRAAIEEKIAEQNKVGHEAIAAGDIETGELALIRVALLGGNPGDYFQKKYLVTADDLKAALAPRKAMKPADQVATIEPLPAASHAKKIEITKFARARYNSTMAPELAQTDGVYLTTTLGTLVVPSRTFKGASVGGGWAPVFSQRIGTPVLSRLIKRTAGVGAWDDFTVFPQIGYAAGKPEDGERGFSGQISASYTAVVGLHLEAFELLGGARAHAGAFKLAGTTGHEAGLAYFGTIGARVTANAALVAAGWAPMPLGDRRWGGELWLSAHTDSSNYKNNETGIQTAYLTLRVEALELDACAAKTGGCADVPDLRVWTVAFGFGAVYQ